jgi:hypothetical protein
MNQITINTDDSHRTDPSLIQQSAYPSAAVSYAEEPHYSFAPSPVPFPPARLTSPPSPLQHQQQHQHQHQRDTDPQMSLPSPYLSETTYLAQSSSKRRNSVRSTASNRSSRDRPSPLAGSELDGEGNEKEKGRCPHPDCGRVFKDLKAHMLTHQAERPGKFFHDAISVM